MSRSCNTCAVLARCGQGFRAAALLALLAVTGTASAQTERGNRTIWKGRSDAYDIEWSTSNLRVTRSANGVAVLDAALDAKARWARLIPPAKGMPMELTVTYRLLSVVGPYLSIEETEYCDCGGAHPSAVKRFHAINLNRSAPGAWAAASLTEMFAPTAVSTVLRHDAVVQRALGSGSPPKLLPGLLDALRDRTVRIKQCDYSFLSEPIESFAFYDARGSSVLVRLGLPAASEVCRGDLAQLGLTFTAPKAALGSLTGAKQRRNGLLMVDAQRLAKPAVTTFEFERTK